MAKRFANFYYCNRLIQQHGPFVETHEKIEFHPENPLEGDEMNYFQGHWDTHIHPRMTLGTKVYHVFNMNGESERSRWIVEFTCVEEILCDKHGHEWKFMKTMTKKEVLEYKHKEGEFNFESL